MFAAIMRVKGYSMRYTVILEREEDGGYVAVVPAYPAVFPKATLVMRQSGTSARPQISTSKIVSPPVTQSRLKLEKNTSNSRPASVRESADGHIRSGTHKSAFAGGIRR